MMLLRVRRRSGMVSTLAFYSVLNGLLTLLALDRMTPASAALGHGMFPKKAGALGGLAVLGGGAGGGC